MTVTTLIVLAHPDLARSHIAAPLAAGVADLPGVTVRDLAALYPDGAIDIEAEQRALEAADTVVLQYPTYWYSPPGMLKAWMDAVLLMGWAYGQSKPGVLAGKGFRVVTSTGGIEAAYSPDGFHGFAFDDVLIPMRAIARRLGMRWLKPLVVHGVRDVTPAELDGFVGEYRRMLQGDAEGATAAAAVLAAA
ncbi:NAD(P)H-dependent oxidoreductase [Diaminobutyricibacter sp. McL0618]|uniref:NAD(P)H-dependent oxidoreductase n=1 Tax=Leifsonia sp. McL0618 TaxID=3415677 RepID=UPI003CF1E17F